MAPVGFHCLVRQRIAPHITHKDISKRNDGTLSRGDFAYDSKANTYPCPQSKFWTVGPMKGGFDV